MIELERTVILLKSMSGGGGGGENNTSGLIEALEQMIDNLRKEVYAKFKLRESDDIFSKKLLDLESRVVDVEDRSLHSKN
jgi:hypothetical protein